MASSFYSVLSFRDSSAELKAREKERKRRREEEGKKEEAKKEDGRKEPKKYMTDNTMMLAFR